MFIILIVFPCLWISENQLPKHQGQRVKKSNNVLIVVLISENMTVCISVLSQKPFKLQYCRNVEFRINMIHLALAGIISALSACWR